LTWLHPPFAAIVAQNIKKIKIFASKSQIDEGNIDKFDL